MKQVIYIASDHGGYNLKNEIIKAFEKSLPEIDLNDLGPFELDLDDDYPDYAFRVAEKVSEATDSVGILICRSGNGMVIAANKVKGAYAALCFGVEHAKKARRDDNANIVCLDADYNGDAPAAIAKSFIKATFAGMDTRHGRRFEKIVEYEKSR